MANVTLAVSKELKSKIGHFSWVTWSDVAREELLADLKRRETLHKLDELLKNSELTDKDILELSKKARKGRFDELKSKGLV